MQPDAGIDGEVLVRQGLQLDGACNWMQQLPETLHAHGDLGAISLGKLRAMGSVDVTIPDVLRRVYVRGRGSESENESEGEREKEGV